MNKNKNTSNPRGAPVDTSVFTRRGRGDSPQTYRLTGRDGPPGTEMIRGAPAWLARGTPLQCMNVTMHDCINENKGRGQPTSARGKPRTKPVISTRYEERSATEKLKSNRFLPALPMTKECRGTPAERGNPVQGMNAEMQERVVYLAGKVPWLARGTPVQCMNVTMHECMIEGKTGGNLPLARGKPPHYGTLLFNRKQNLNGEKYALTEAGKTHTLCADKVFGYITWN